MSAFLDDDAIPLAPIGLQALHSVKFLIGLLLIPICWVTLETFFVSFDLAAKQASFWKTAEFWFFGIGAVLCLVIFFGARSRWLMVIYVFGHEWTHALFVWICRGRVAKVKISATGGHVLTDRNNFLISLSPYFFPFYTIAAIAAWGLIGWMAGDFGDRNVRWLFGAVGFTWCFHFAFTIWMITRDDQPDLDQNGRVFSLSVIALVNTLIVTGLLIWATPSVGWSAFGIAWWENFSSFGARLTESVREIVSFFV